MYREGFYYEKSIHEHYAIGIIAFHGDGTADGGYRHSLTKR